ncbi:MAG: DUF445 domain-containing protein [Fusobacteriaceae bacterium]
MGINLIIKAVLIILIGSLIGWITNYFAIKMLFRPYREINLFFFKIQGVIPKRRHEIGMRIADTIKNQVISMEDILRSLDRDQLGHKLEEIVDNILKGRIKEEIIKKFPMAAMFLSDSIVEKIESGIKELVLKNREEIIKGLFQALESNVNFEEIIVKNIDGFSLEELEEITFKLAESEFRHIEIVGAVLGGIIGVLQLGISFIIV